MTQIALVYVLFGNRAAAEAAAQAMIARKLAACANILAPCTSVYPWDGAVTQGEEVPAIFKTLPAKAAALMAALAEMHGYDLPAILSWPATTTAAYAQWVGEQTGD